MSSDDDEGYASAEEGVPTASSTKGPVNATTVPTQTIRDAAATLAPVANGISELSPEQRAQLLQARPPRRGDEADRADQQPHPEVEQQPRAAPTGGVRLARHRVQLTPEPAIQPSTIK